MSAARAVGGWFGPGDDIGRAWDEAEAILRACEDLDAVMATIRDAESPVEARRALKLRFDFTGRQAALLLTLPVMAFTRSERARMDEARRARMDLVADVTGVLPAIREVEPPSAEPQSAALLTPGPPAPSASPTPLRAVPRAGDAERSSDEVRGSDGGWDSEFDGALALIRSAMEEPRGDAGPAQSPEPSPEPPPGSQPMGAWSGPGRRSMARQDDAATVIDEQIGEVCDAIAGLLGTIPPAASVATGLANPSADDPRRSDSPSGALLDSCGVDDATGIRTLLWHLRRTGLDSVEGLLPFAEPLTAARGFDVQAARFEQAMGAGTLGSEPGGAATWAGRLWPIAERSGFGYAVSYRSGPGAGAVWAYGGDQPLHRLWDSVVDLLVELYQALTAGASCDSALAAVMDGRVVWTNLS